MSFHSQLGFFASLFLFLMNLSEFGCISAVGLHVMLLLCWLFSCCGWGVLSGGDLFADASLCELMSPLFWR